MTIKDLREAIQDLPDVMEVVVLSDEWFLKTTDMDNDSTRFVITVTEEQI